MADLLNESSMQRNKRYSESSTKVEPICSAAEYDPIWQVRMLPTSTLKTWLYPIAIIVVCRTVAVLSMDTTHLTDNGIFKAFSWMYMLFACYRSLCFI